MLREALRIGLEALESGARCAHVSATNRTDTLLQLDVDTLCEAAEVVDGLVALGDVVNRLDATAIGALADLDIEVLQALARLDPAIIDTLAMLDVQPLVELQALDIDRVVWLADAVADTAKAP